MKKTFSIVLTAVALMISVHSANAQISHGGDPLFNHSAAKVFAEDVMMAFVDNDKYIQEDLNQAKGAGPMRMGIMQHQTIDVLKAAKVVKDDRGSHYLLSVSSLGAKFMSLHFSEYRLPDGAELFFYDQSGDVVIGAYNATDVKEDGTFYTQSLPGSSFFIEYNVPAGVEPGSLVIDMVCHGYKDIFSSMADLSGDISVEMKGAHGVAEGNCHINVVCSDGDDWRDQIRSVVAIQISTSYGSYMCSGALVNNTNQDRTPYVLSAYHCQDLGTSNLSFVTYFLYQTNTCSGNSGVSNRSVTGASIVAKYSYAEGSDFLLLRLSSAIPNTYKPYYAGWDRTNDNVSAAGCCIHHPGGDFKKISIPRVVQRGTGYYNHFLIVSWYTGTANKGVTEQGSSGSPLFNANKHIIGQLYAGRSSCDTMDGLDLYGRFYNSWNGQGGNANSLKSWLDPNNTGVTTLDGLDYKDNVDIDEPDRVTARQLTVYPNPTNGMVRFDVDALGDANFKVFDLNGRCVMEGRTILTATTQAVNLKELPAGTYVLNLYTSARNYTATVIVTK